MHLKKITLFPQKYPEGDHYPFNLPVLQRTESIGFNSPITFFVGENGAGKSTLLRAAAKKCRIHIWKDEDKVRFESNPFEELLYKFIDVSWTNGSVNGSYFDSELSRVFAQHLDEWASADPGIFDYFGGKSLLTQSHGQSLLSYFKHRYQIKGLYLMDEPETALSPRSQLELLDFLQKMARAGHAQFIIATHSPILLACPDAVIYSFDHVPLQKIVYKQTEHYRIYKDFMANH